MAKGKGSNKHAAHLPNPAMGKTASSPGASGGKTAIQKVSWQGENPSWRVRSLEMCDPFGWHRVAPRKQQEILQKLGEFESMTWEEILVQGKKSHHSIDVTDICSEAQARLRQTRHKCARELVSLRLSGPERIWGCFDGRVLDLLWWDPKHSICPSAKKHT